MSDTLREAVEREMRAYSLALKSGSGVLLMAVSVDDATEVAVRIARNLSQAAEGAHKLAEEALAKSEAALIQERKASFGEHADALEWQGFAEAAERALAEELERRGHVARCTCGCGIDGCPDGCVRAFPDPRCAPPPAAEPARPTIVTLCGSTRFYEAWQEAIYDETMAGRIVLSVGFYPHAADKAHAAHVGVTPEQKVALDVLHKQKIDMSDEILVLNVGGYIGESTRGEIAHAESTGKRVRYLEPPAAEPSRCPCEEETLCTADCENTRCVCDGGNAPCDSAFHAPRKEAR